MKKILKLLNDFRERRLSDIQGAGGLDQRTTRDDLVENNQLIELHLPGERNGRVFHDVEVQKIEYRK
ncbi:hypothetical protein D3C72_2120220 [compost metagenome]